ncbi:MAG: PH domain-containing protein [Verrucomicrobiota bacterium]
MNGPGIIFRPAANTQILVVTIAASVALLAVGCLLAFLGFKFWERTAIRFILLGNGLLMFLLLAGSLNFKIWAYEIHDGILVIKHGLSVRKILVAQIEEARVEEYPFMGGTRKFGVGGFWSVFGWFSSPRLGPFFAYATDTRKGVLLRLPDQQILVTPAETEEFMRAVRTPK